MAETVPYDPGARIAYYRKQLKLSAEDLAEQAGFGLTRSIIANIENGRKDDLTVRQLIAIAYALRVSPGELLFDLTKPYHDVEITGKGDGADFKTATWLAADWFSGSLTALELHSEYQYDADDKMTSPQPFLTPTYALEYRMILQDIRTRNDLLYRLERLERPNKTDLGNGLVATSIPEDDPVIAGDIRAIHAKLYTLDRSLRARGVDIDNPVFPGFPF